MFPSWRSLLNWKPIKMEGLRRAADGIQPAVIIDLTTLDDMQPVIKHLADRNNGVYVCPVCIESPEEPVTTMCGHIFCKECLIAALVPFQNCPMCKKNVSSFVRLYI
ncbi:uncharacterized protein [Drosophila takahashii]|uniref:uncharacterized protein n=1 Tax=Drosophila takahashii TaxID=29030 RepID=UPI001CF8CBD3|nr:E3 ubiquitin-protein ligase RMA3 [Drosophila takahashii]